MVVTQLIGGLGNQLFQYSIGRTLAEKYSVRLKLDLSSFDEYRLRPYALAHFRIHADIMQPEEARELRLNRVRTGVSGKLERLLRRPAIRSVSERSFAFDPSVLEVRPPCYLKGYWQSPKYFRSIDAVICQELTLTTPISGSNEATASVIASVPSVAVHVRRGDYVTDPHTHQYHGICGPDYYYEAERRLRAAVGNVHLFVFSDDAQWAEDNLRFRSPSTFVSHNSAEQGHEDLRLMTLCRHHIIANSTFSWWGAWLSRHPDKVVIAPRHWFREAGHSADDLIPETWIRL